jgi:hypothetical protein
MTPGRKLSDQHVGVPAQLNRVRHARAARRFEVEHDTALVAIERHEWHTFVADIGRQITAQIAGRGFDLDDVGAHVSEGHSASRAGDHLGEVDDLEVFQGSIQHGDMGRWL